jgi:hypothetical protein
MVLPSGGFKWGVKPNTMRGYTNLGLFSNFGAGLSTKRVRLPELKKGDYK